MANPEVSKDVVIRTVRLAKQVSALDDKERQLFQVFLDLADFIKEDPEKVTRLIEEFVKKHQYEDPYKDKMYEHN